jgi:glycine oxidase
MSDCVIIGGGIIGMMTAMELRQSGATVMLIERGKVGQESSWAGGGILSPMYPWHYPEAITCLAQWSQKHYPIINSELIDKTGIDPQLSRGGMLILDKDMIDEGIKWAKLHDCKIEKLDPEGIINRVPGINRDLCQSALWMPNIDHIRNPRLVKALKKYLCAIGVEIKEHSPVKRILIRKGQAVGAATEQNEYKCAHLVIACGAWSQELMRSLQSCPPIRPVRGQMLLYKHRAGAISPIIVYKSQYIIPRRDGYVLVGSTLEEAGFDKNVTREALFLLSDAAARIIPELAKSNIERHWAGLRPGSPDGTPFICKISEIERLYLNSGHYRNGLLLAPVSARMLCDLIQGRPPLVDPQPYQLQ